MIYKSGYMLNDRLRYEGRDLLGPHAWNTEEGFVAVIPTNQKFYGGAVSRWLTSNTPLLENKPYQRVIAITQSENALDDIGFIVEHSNEKGPKICNTQRGIANTDLIIGTRTGSPGQKMTRILNSLQS